MRDSRGYDAEEAHHADHIRSIDATVDVTTGQVQGTRPGKGNHGEVKVWDAATGMALKPSLTL